MCWCSFLEQRSASKNTSIYKTGAYLLRTLGRIELERLHEFRVTTETGIGTMGRSISPQVIHAAISSTVNSQLVLFSSFRNRTRGCNHRRLLVHQGPAQ